MTESGQRPTSNKVSSTIPTSNERGLNLARNPPIVPTTPSVSPLINDDGSKNERSSSKRHSMGIRPDTLKSTSAPPPLYIMRRAMTRNQPNPKQGYKAMLTRIEEKKPKTDKEPEMDFSKFLEGKVPPKPGKIYKPRHIPYTDI